MVKPKEFIHTALKVSLEDLNWWEIYLQEEARDNVNKKGMFYSIFKDLKATRGSTTYSTWVRTFYSRFEVQRLLAVY